MQDNKLMTLVNSRETLPAQAVSDADLRQIVGDPFDYTVEAEVPAVACSHAVWLGETILARAEHTKAVEKALSGAELQRIEGKGGSTEHAVLIHSLRNHLEFLGRKS